jgi:hypothetical protein
MKKQDQIPSEMTTLVLEVKRLRSGAYAGRSCPTGSCNGGNSLCYQRTASALG